MISYFDIFTELICRLDLDPSSYFGFILLDLFVSNTPLDGPKLSPFSNLGLIQFSPEEITSSDLKSMNQKMKISYYSLKRTI